MELKIGCTGWSYAGWSGTFYPKSMESSKWLEYYSKIFDITEINSTYYRIPNQYMTKKWNLSTPKNFRFSAKFPGKITHEHKLQNVKPYVSEFLHAMNPLREKLDALVFQLPPSLSFLDAKPRLDEIFAYLPADYARYPIEGRHESWFEDEAIDYLTEKNWCLVWNEISGVNNPAPITSDYVYLRLIGDRSIPESEFGKVVKDRSDLIGSWADKLKKLESKVGLAMIMANNHFQGFAPATVNSLRAEFGLSELIWEEKKQRSLGDF